MFDIISQLDTAITHPSADGLKNLEQSLTQSVATSVKDANFRSQLGCSPDFWQVACRALVAFASEEAAQVLVLLIKLIRNAVVNELVNQQLAIEYGALVEVEKIMQRCMQQQDRQAITTLQVGVQAICNMLTRNEVALGYIWKEWMRDLHRGKIYSDLLAMHDDTVVMSTLVLILNCIQKSQERCRLMVKSKAGRTIITVILDDLERLHDNEESRNFELGYTIINQLIEFGHFVTLYRSVESEDGTDGRIAMLLKVLDSKIHAYNGPFPSFMGHKELKKVASLLKEQSESATSVLRQVHSHSGEELPLTVDNISKVYTSAILVLQIAATLLMMDENEENQGRKELREMLSENNAMEAVIELLRQSEGMNLAKGTTPELRFNYLKRDCVRFIGALCYENRAMQDKVRDLQGIGLVLSQCKIDDTNPYLREHAVFAIRNILQNNEENQKLVAELTPLEAVQTQELSDMGLSARLVDGKVVLDKKE